MTFGLLAWIIDPSDVFSQTKLEKDEIINEFRTIRASLTLDSIFRWEVHRTTRGLLDDLLAAGIDTLLIYSVYFPGYASLSKDSCVDVDPFESYFFWTKNGNYVFRQTDGHCKTTAVDAKGDVIRFALDQFEKIHDELFMPAISGVVKTASTFECPR